MMKKILIYIVFLFFCLSGFAQTDSTEAFSILDNNFEHFKNPIYTDYGIVVTDGRETKLYLIKNNKLEVIYDDCAGLRFLSSSPDKSQIAFKVFKDNTQTPAYIDLKTREVVQLHPLVHNAGQPSISSRNIVFTIDTVICVYNKEIIKTFFLGDYVNLIYVSPDGEKIAVPDDNGYISIIDIESGNKLKLTSGASLKWSPDSKKIVYTSFNPFGLRVYELETKKTYSLTDTHLDYGRASWADNSEIVLFGKFIHREGSDLMPNMEIYISDYKGENITLLETDLPIVNEPRFGKGKQIILHTNENKEIYQIELDNTYRNKIDMTLLFKYTKTKK